MKWLLLRYTSNLKAYGTDAKSGQFHLIQNLCKNVKVKNSGLIVTLVVTIKPLFHTYQLYRLMSSFFFSSKIVFEISSETKNSLLPVRPYLVSNAVLLEELRITLLLSLYEKIGAIKHCVV